MTGATYLAAVVLAGVFVWAAAAKLARPASATAGLEALGIPAATFVARGLPFVELALAVVLLAVPTVGGLLALAILAAFSAVLAARIRAGVVAPCACFGAARREPVSFVELARNGLLAALAVAALFAHGPAWPSVGTVATATVAVLAGGFALRALRLRARARP